VKRFVSRWVASRLPPATIRLRLTALYGALFLASGAALLAITYILVAHELNGRFFITNSNGVVAGAVKVTVSKSGQIVGATGHVQKTLAPPRQHLLLSGPQLVPKPTPAQLIAQAHAQSAAALNQLLTDSGIALAVMALLSIWLGWLIAGRALRPLRTISNAARDISATNLHRRLALRGPNDELKQLGNTFDGLLERLETAFDAQRQFVANASHELRTPLTYERALLEVALADPNASEETLRDACAQALAVGEQQERLIEALLTLSRSQRGLESRQTVNLAEIATTTLRTTPINGAAIDANLAPALIQGDPRLIERLVANLVDNALKYNLPHGRVTVSTNNDQQRATLAITNTGPLVPAAELERLFQPFQRLDPNRTNSAGTGLGLSIVQAIATAHGGELSVRPGPAGGLHIEVAFAGAPA